MTAKKPTTILAYDHEDREVREFRPCSTCRYDQRAPDTGVAFCAMFGWVFTGDARRSNSLCGRHGDAWRAKGPKDFAAVPMVERVLG